MLTELPLGASAGSEIEGASSSYTCVKNSEVPEFRCLIGWIVKTYDYFLYVASTLPQSVCVGT